MSKARCGLLCMIALLAACERITFERAPPAGGAERPVTQALIGEWYNTEIGRYPTPSITFVRFHPAGGIVVGGLDGSQRYGQYSVAQDGTLRVRIAAHSRASVIVDDDEAGTGSDALRLRPRPSRLIIDSVPVVSDQSLELQARGRIFLFTRDTQQKARLEAAMLAYREAHAQALLRAEAVRREGEAAQQARLSGEATREDDEPEDSEDDEDEEETDREPEPHRVTVRFSGDGAGSSACTGALLQQLSRPGLRVSAGGAAAMVEIELSGIAYRRGAWGRYHELHYRARISDARDRRVLASLDATETASGSGAFEVCADVGEDLGDEIEDLLEDDD
jgi:hypothetical protein